MTTYFNALVSDKLELLQDPSINSVLLMLADKDNDANWLVNWVKNNGGNLDGVPIYEISPEVSDAAGGLGRVEQYHTNGLKELGASPFFIEPYYRERKNKNGQWVAADYTQVNVPLHDIKAVTGTDGQAITFTVQMSDNGDAPVQVEVFQGVNDNGLTCYMIRDTQGKYIRRQYFYNDGNPGRENEPKMEIFTEFFTKATCEFIIQLEYQKFLAQGEAYKPPIMNVNDGQSMLTLLWARLAYINALKAGDEVKAGFLSRILLCATTHTYKNRGIFDYNDGWRQHFKRMGVPEEYHYLFLARHDGNLKVDLSSAGLRCADFAKGVAAIHAKEMNPLDPKTKYVGVTNGDNRFFSTNVFRRILGEVNAKAVPDSPSPADIKEVKKRAKTGLTKTLVEKRKGINAVRAASNKRQLPVIDEKCLDPELPLFTYSGRWVEEKASRRAFALDSLNLDTLRGVADKIGHGQALEQWEIDHLEANNIVKLIRAGGQLVIYGNVQEYDSSRNLGEKMELLEAYLQSRKKADAKTYRGNFVFMPSFSLAEQIELLAATDVQIQDSDRFTGACEYTEADVSANGGLQLSPPYHEGIIANQGRPVNFEHPEKGGNTLVPLDSRPESYLALMLKVANMAQDKKGKDKLAMMQSRSVRLSRVLEARNTSAQYLREWSKAYQQLQSDLAAGTRTQIAKRFETDREIGIQKVFLLVTGEDGETTFIEANNREINIPKNATVKIVYHIKPIYDENNIAVNDQILARIELSNGMKRELNYTGMFSGLAVYEAILPTDNPGAVNLFATSGLWNAFDTMNGRPKISISPHPTTAISGTYSYFVADDGTITLRIPAWENSPDVFEVDWGRPMSGYQRGETGWAFNNGAKEASQRTALHKRSKKLGKKSVIYYYEATLAAGKTDGARMIFANGYHNDLPLDLYPQAINTIMLYPLMHQALLTAA